MTYTLTIENADQSLINTLKGVLRLAPSVHFSVKKSKDEGFYSEENMRRLEEQVRLYNEGKATLVTKTFDELGITE